MPRRAEFRGHYSNQESIEAPSQARVESYIKEDPSIEDWVTKTFRDEVFTEIARCESNFNPHAKNPKSSATGLFQIIDGTWEYYGEKLWGDEYLKKSRLNYRDNANLAWYIYTVESPSHWECYTKTHT